MSNAQYGLGEPAMLEKIDKLFACGVGELVDLPQIVVVGDQSSGKSSVLEGLIKKPLPRDSGLCTRFATQIVFRRAKEENVFVSIIPAKDASVEHTSKLKAWKKDVRALDSEAFAEIMNEAHEQMGLSSKTVDENATPKPTFSNDVLHLEIAGPDQEHLSVIDVPGIFKSTTPGLTTKSDIPMVRNMVKSYMENPRSIILTVIPANADAATQEILELATEVDSNGDRTLGILTKPDLVDRGAEPGVIDLMEGRARTMKLGWHMIRNPGKLELTDVSLNREVLETEFFRSTAHWSGINKDKVGIDALRARLKEILLSLVKREFPKVKTEIKTRQSTLKKRLSDLGPERASSAAQSAYLTSIADTFQRLVNSALAANYGSDDAFDDQNLRIAPTIRARMSTFSHVMAECGEAHAFLDNDGGVPADQPDEDGVVEVREEAALDELDDILYPPESLPTPARGDIRDWLLDVFEENRGFELGTFNATILATTMKKQSYKWSGFSLGYVSDIIVTIHTFITTALCLVCRDRDVRETLTSALSEDLLGRYQKAIDNAKFLINVENNSSPMTLNHYFNDNLQKGRFERLKTSLRNNAIDCSAQYGKEYESMFNLKTMNVDTVDMSNDDHVILEIHDILKSYYQVTRKTFVDSVTKQSVGHFLLHSDESPLKLFSPVFVSQLTPEELADIAGEAPGVKRMRSQLSKELASLDEAMKILARA